MPGRGPGSEKLSTAGSSFDSSFPNEDCCISPAGENLTQALNLYKTTIDRVEHLASETFDNGAVALYEDWHKFHGIASPSNQGWLYRKKNINGSKHHHML
jgi:hypothetical protein